MDKSMTPAAISMMCARERLPSAFEEFLLAVRKADTNADDATFVSTIAKAASDPQKSAFAFAGVMAIARSFPALLGNDVLSPLYKALLAQAGKRTVSARERKSEVDDFYKIILSRQDLAKNDGLMDAMVQFCALETDEDVRLSAETLVTTCLGLHASNGNAALKAVARVAHGSDTEVCKRMGRIAVAICRIPALRKEASEVVSVIEAKTNDTLLPRRKARTGRPAPNRAAWTFEV